ncbi:TonB-dependent receptor [Thalassotalea ponticola]|uniref:TonB-dependent receptor n=1 Tax=Thalassotalea ponticola TaxID=1523392 RepID=UPI0025B5FBAC|nr:TonB-dependent receptor [Thalassotalea ponticola]MDN3653739.1 TonB-dependent receptor [Thalassotalea ponticola]
MSLYRYVVSLACTFSLQATASVQSAEQAADQSLAMERIVVQNQSSRTTLVSGVNKQAIANVNPEHIEQLMVRISGSEFHRGSGVEYLPSLRSGVLTGAGACGSLLTLVDSIPLRAAGFCNINELFEAPLAHAQYIEVFKGPWSSVFGSNAQNGVINVITPNVIANDFADLDLSVGSEDIYRAGIDINHADSAIRGQLSVTSDHGWRQSSGVEQQNLYLKHQTESRHRRYTSTFSLNHLAQQTATYVVGKDAYKDEQLSQLNANPDAYRDAYSLRAAVHIEQDLQNGDVISLSPYLRHNDMAFLMHFLPGQPIEQNRQQSIGIKSQYQTSSQPDLQWLMGFDGEFSQGSLLQYQDGPTLGSNFLQATIPEGKHYDYRVNALYAGAFARLDWLVSDRLSWQLGLRVDYQGYDYHNNMLAGRTDENGVACEFGGCRYSRPENREDSFTTPSYQLGMQYRLSDDSQLYINAGHGFRAPQATELYRLQREQQSADLGEEQTDSIEFGYAITDSVLSLKLALYYSEKQQLIIRNSDAFNINGAGSRHHGIELDLNWPINRHLTYFQHSSFNRHRYTHGQRNALADIAGNDLDSAPKHLHTLGMQWQASDRVSAQLQYRWVDDYFTDAENQHHYQGHQLIDVLSQYQLNKRLKLQLRVLNLLDTRYAARADYSSFSGDRYFPGQSRRFYADINYQF